MSSAKSELGHLREGYKKLQSTFKKTAVNALPRSREKRKIRVSFLLRLQWASRRVELPMDEQDKPTHHGLRGGPASAQRGTPPSSRNVHKCYGRALENSSTTNSASQFSFTAFTPS